MASKVHMIVSDDDQDDEVTNSSGAEENESDDQNDEVTNSSRAKENESDDQNDDATNSLGAEENESNDDDDSDHQSAEDEKDEDDLDKSKANPGWADAMKKILSTNKPKRKKSIVLSKAKKLNEVKIKPKEVPIPFEIETKDGEIKKETVKLEESAVEKVKTEHKKHKRKETLGIRVKPSISDRERERYLQKIATNGVVQLFNAVSQQRKDIEDRLKEAGPLERKREKALKNIDRKAFLDVLMGGTNKISDDSQEDIKEEDEDTSTKKKDDKVWSVLKDDFVMGAKLKDWDKHDTDDNDSSAPEDMDSD